MVFPRNKKFRFAFLPLLLIASLAAISNNSSLGQIDFEPEHPQVRAMAENAVQYLTSVSPGGRGELILAALAVTECSKRYENTVPVDHPLVVKAVDKILAGLNRGPEDPTGIIMENATYIPALACILLCDVDDEKYKDQISALVRELERRQHGDGGYCYSGKAWSNIGDTSQMQYVGLALYVAHHHGFKVNLDVAKRAVEWLAASNSYVPQGSWWYHYNGRLPYGSHKDKVTLSIHAAGAGTLYLLADFLQLTPRSKRGANGRMKSSLPPSVSVYVKPKDVGAAGSKKGPLVSTNIGSINSAKRRANQFFANNFVIEIKMWNYYYLYALERYAYFRERAEGEFKEQPTWYDKGVRHLMTQVDGDGGFRQGKSAASNRAVTSSFAILFLVRSSEVLVLPSNASRANGNLGFAENVRIKQTEKGGVQQMMGVQGIENVMEMLKNGDVEDDRLELIVQSMGPAIAGFSEGDDKSRNEKMAFMRGLVTERNYYRRLIAVKFLAREQVMDNVPALLYALGDPDLRICREAHNGLRLISRKLDSISVPESATAEQYKAVKRQWTDWFLKIRPDAELLD